MATYKQLTMREAYDLFVAECPVERYFGTEDDPFDVGLLSERYSTAGVGEWKAFKYTYDHTGVLFRVAVE